MKIDESVMGGTLIFKGHNPDLVAGEVYEYGGSLYIKLLSDNKVVCLSTGMCIPVVAFSGKLTPIKAKIVRDDQK